MNNNKDTSFYKLFRKYNFKFIAWNNVPTEVDIPPKVYYAKSIISFYLIYFYTNLMYDYIEVEMMLRDA